MSRYIHDIQTTRSAAEVAVAVTSYLDHEGFKRETHKGEDVWEKGLGLMMGPQYIKADPVDGKIHLEAWTSMAIFPGVFVGEMGTTGIVGAPAKRKLRKRVKELESLIA